MNWLTDTWYKQHPVRWLLSPFSGLYRLIISIRRLAYQYDFFTRHQQTVPVIVVGNISVGGTGKTPFVIWLAKQLQQAGFHPGIVSRGYGGSKQDKPKLLSKDSKAEDVGDEPVLIAQHTACPVVVYADRNQACSHLLTQTDCNLIITDDGLQHYALARDIEIVIVDNERQFGNRFCLPAGPLREPVSRLSEVDFIVYNGGTKQPYTMQLQHSCVVNLADVSITKPLSFFQGQNVHSVAGIGNPQRFFRQLEQQQINIIEHAFADHHHFTAEDLSFNDDLPILMTEKDAVKCLDFATNSMWYIKTEAQISDSMLPLIIQRIAGTPTHG